MKFSEAVAKAATPEYMEHNGKLCVRRASWREDIYVFCRDGMWATSWTQVNDLHTDGVDWTPHKISKIPKIHKPSTLSVLKCGDVIRLKTNYTVRRLVVAIEGEKVQVVNLGGTWYSAATVDNDWELVPEETSTR